MCIEDKVCDGENNACITKYSGSGSDVSKYCGMVSSSSNCDNEARSGTCTCTKDLCNGADGSAKGGGGITFAAVVIASVVVSFKYLKL